MDKLTVLENELVPVYVTDKGIKVVDGRELHKVLQSKQDFSTWVKKRLKECDAEENTDYEVLHNFVEQVSGGKYRIDYTIKLDTAKEMAMLERNDKGKQVRKYFIEVEKKHKSAIIDRAKLSPQMQMFYALADNQAEIELEQKRQAEKLEQQEKHIEKLEQTQEAIADTFQKTNSTEDFQKWANNRIAQIAESPKFDKGYGKKMNYAFARTESYDRLKQKRNCRLDDRVEKAVGRAVKERPDIKKSDLQKINKIYIIANDKDLKPAYELVIKEMMVYYCVGGGQK